MEFPLKISLLDDAGSEKWDNYVFSHSKATIYHLSGWKNVIENSYGHRSYYLMAERADDRCSAKNIQGVLPLVYLKHFILGNNLISLPFFDNSGIIANNESIEKELLSRALSISNQLKSNLEIRCIEPINWLNKRCSAEQIQNIKSIEHINTNKVSMLLDLPENSEILMKLFKSKLRSQIQKPIKEGLDVKIGGIELLDAFYDIFSINMRNLGSPVHSKQFLANILDKFKDRSKICIVYKATKAFAGSIIIGFNKTLSNPWASSLSQYNKLCPNMLLYWGMLRYACDNNYNKFDFGRSTHGEGTYRFKKQWGAQAMPLFWYFFDSAAQGKIRNHSQKDKFGRFIRYWKGMPVPISRILGPLIRKHIGL